LDQDLPRITDLLRAWSRGDTTARDKLIPFVYNDLRRRARAALRRERAGHSLQATALVHEAFLRLVGQKSLEWQDRDHFYAVAARVMRQVLVDHARARGAVKRGSGEEALSLDSVLVLTGERPAALIALDDALNELESLDPHKSRVVDLHFFGGLSMEETADALAISHGKAKRDWSLARAWLFRYLQRSSPSGGMSGTSKHG